MRLLLERVGALSRFALKAAKMWLQTATAIPIKTEEDQVAQSDIDKLLQKI